MTLIKQLTVILTAIIAAIFGGGAYAQDKTTEIDSIFNWTATDAPGCVCAASQHGKVVVSRAYGSADLDRNLPLSENSIFDIGSTHKQFVAASVLLLVEDGKLSLTEDIHKYIPELPDYGHRITLDHLLTHTSGIRDWTGLLMLSDGKTDVLTLIMRQRGLNFVPGEAWSYSNSGYVLVKEIIARVSGLSFAEFASKRLFEPLGMKSTWYSVDMRDENPDRAMAYEKEGGSWKKYMRLDNNRGGGGVLSTAGDLLTWNESLANGRLGHFVTQKLQEPAKLNNGRELKYTRGLFIDSYRGGIPMIAHSGGSAGYSTWLGRFPEQGLSVAVLCNVEPISATRHAHLIADLFLPTTDSPELEGDGPPPAVPAGIDVNSKTGLYFDEETGTHLQLITERGFFRIAGGPGLVAVTNDHFRRWGAALHFMSQDAFEINFLSPDEFELKSMEGKTSRYRRAKPHVYNTDDLVKFTGRYENKEIGSLLDIAPNENGLSVTLGHAPDKKLPFESVGPETFHWNKRMFIRFRRSPSGEVISLEYTNPVLNDIEFSRVN